MAFPDDPTDLTVDLNIGGTWTDVTSFVMGRDPVTIGRGRSDDAPGMEPSSMTVTFNNRDGRFSPRNPTSPYFGLLGRNTPIRAYVNRGPVSLDLPGAKGDEATAPDAAALGITGDIDIRIDVTTESWTARHLCGKYVVTGNQISWALQVGTGGLLDLVWSNNGSTLHLAQSTLPIPVYPGRLAIRATLDVNNGAGSHTATFYTAATIAGPWVQLGATTQDVLGPSVTSIFDSTAPVEVGDIAALTHIVGFSTVPALPVVGRIHAFELRNGIGGTVVANPGFDAQAAGTASFADTAGVPNTWTVAGGASISNRRWRFHGELSTLPPRWDISGRDVWVPAVAGGLTRRLGQRSAPLRSTIYRGVLSEDAVVSYWSCEDGSDAASIASGLPGGRPMTFTGAPNLAASDAFAASEALPTIGNSVWSGPVATYIPAGESQVRFLLQIPAAGATNNAVVARVVSSGTAARWDIVYTTASGGSLSYKVFDNDGGTLLSPGSTVNGLNGLQLRISLEMTQDGSDIDSELWVMIAGASSAVGLPNTITSATFGRIKTVVVDPGANLDDVTVGHISVHSAITPLDDLTDELTGYLGEPAGRRIERLCTEEGIAFRPIGDLDATATMGVQHPATLLELWSECAQADLGLLFEPRDVVGIGYRTRASLYNQAPQVAVDYAAHELSAAPESTDDDQTLVNDVTVFRAGGSSARFEVTDGPLSVADPPDGAGRYESQDTINIDADEHLPDQAAWRAHLGTVDEARYPQLAAAFHSHELAANPTLVRQLLEAQIGDLITVTNPPPWLPQHDITQIIQGTRESITNKLHDMTINCSPASLYHVGVYGLDRYETAGATLTADVSASATSLSVATTSGPIWTTNAADMPFDISIAGEQVRVTAITGSSSPQTFTATRAINGVTKTHPAGTAVSLWSPAVYAL